MVAWWVFQNCLHVLIEFATSVGRVDTVPLPVLRAYQHEAFPKSIPESRIH